MLTPRNGFRIILISLLLSMAWFNLLGDTIIRMTLESVAQESHVKLRIHDALGRELATLINELRHAGVHEVHFEGTFLTSGVYIYSVEASGKKALQRMLLVK